MKKFASFFLYTLLLAAIACASSSCTDDGLDIKQDYNYTVETLPLPKSLKKGESVDLEFSIVREGNYTGTTYQYRYFQSEGEGLLTTDKGQIIPVNRFQSVAFDDFVLTYTNLAEEQAQLDFVFEDNFGKRVEYTITFAGKRTDDKEQK
jgi:hypothetical protein